MVRFDQAYKDELAYFVRVAAGEVPSPCTLRDGLEALRISEAGTISLHEHRPVEVASVVA
jgi:myo-inositol 2-dehydrogenase/D-chiro-inositol 1-dehydrogenase